MKKFSSPLPLPPVRGEEMGMRRGKEGSQGAGGCAHTAFHSCPLPLLEQTMHKQPHGALPELYRTSTSAWDWGSTTVREWSAERCLALLISPDLKRICLDINIFHSKLSQSCLCQPLRYHCPVRHILAEMVHLKKAQGQRILL